MIFVALGVGLFSYANLTEKKVVETKEELKQEVVKVEERDKTIAQLQNDPQIKIPAPTPPNEPEKVVEPDYRGFHFSNYTIVVDLRGRINVPPDMIDNRRISKVTRFLFATIERTTEARKPVCFEFATVGKEIELQCLSAHHSNWEFVPAPRMHQHLDETAGKPQTLRGYQLRVNTDEYETNETFLVAAEAFYWNSYQDDKREWSALVAPEKCDSMTIIHLFPDQKPFTKYALRAYPHRHDHAVAKDPYADTPNLVWNKQNTYLSWHIADPLPLHAYDILWEW